MDRGSSAVAWYRFRATLRRRWGSYLAIVVIIGAIGGLAMGSIAAARRTQSSFATYLAQTNPSDLTVTIFPQSPTTFAAATRQIGAFRALRDVKQVESWIAPLGLPLSRSGVPLFDTLTKITVVASVNGLGFDQDKAAVVSGRMADPHRADEFVTTVAGARSAGWHLGEVVPLGFYTSSQFASGAVGSGRAKAVVSVDAKLVGLVVLSTGVVQDQVDRFPTFALTTPALAAQLAGHNVAAASIDYGLQLDHSGEVAAVENEIEASVPPGTDVQPHVAVDTAARAERAIRPESIALGVFGLIAALAALAIAGQALARGLRANQGDLEVLRALGVAPATALGDSLFGLLVAVVLGALLAAAVAIALSPIGPIGPVRPVYPDRGVAFDWTVLAGGVGMIVVALGTILVVLGVQNLPQRVLGRKAQSPIRRQVVANAAARAGMPVPVVSGVKFALEPRGSGGAVPVRSAFIGTVLAIVVVSATVTFSSGLGALVSHPSLYGWNWSYALASETGPDVPPQAVALLSHDRDVAAWSNATIADGQINGVTIPMIFEHANAPVAPPILSGRLFATKHEIVLGAATIKALHVRLGGTVQVTYGSPKSAPFYLPPTRLRIVGTATMPAIGFPSTEGDHTSMGTGALLPTEIVPKALIAAMQSPDKTLDGPEFVFVRMRTGLSSAAAVADIHRIARAGTRAFATAPHGDGTGDSVLVFSDLLPAEIVNYRSMGSTPALLAASLGLGAVVALGLTLTASVNRRRRDYALLKALGFTGQQVSASVSVQASLVGLVGLVVGLPLGIALGRWLWIEFAHQIYAVATPSVPIGELALVATVALVLVNLVAVIPGWSAANTPAAIALRAE